MQEVIRLTLTMLRLRVLKSATRTAGLTFFSMLLVPETEQVTMDRIQVSEEAVRVIAALTV
ncbi:MAG TPA: hypothetical protein VGR53_04375 [Nitrososphaerales archaeon]|nr:hypothetical protein [Nitrososphaerales archaeon]